MAGLCRWTVEQNGIVIYSDSTLKRDIEDVDSQLENIKNLKSKKYKLKADEKNRKCYGLLAQDLEKIFPEMVFTNEKGTKSIYYIELIPVMLKAIQEQQEQIESYEKSLADIEKRLAKLEKSTIRKN